MPTPRLASRVAPSQTCARAAHEDQRASSEIEADALVPSEAPRLRRPKAATYVIMSRRLSCETALEDTEGRRKARTVTAS